MRTFRLPEINEDLNPTDFEKMECTNTFKSQGLVLELAFDPNSKFLATGSSDSQIKIYDVINGFQTHNFNGHRGIVLGLVFYPDNDSLKLLSTAEDFIIKVWDLVLKKEVAVLKPKGKDDNMAHRTTTMIFTKDKKTLITSGRDGCVHFWNVHANWKLTSSIKVSSLGALAFEEVLSMVYLHIPDDPCLVLGGHSGEVNVYSIKRQQIVHKASESRGLANATEAQDEGNPSAEI